MTVLFVADDGTHGPELWSTDGSTVSLVEDLAAGAAGSGAGPVMMINGVGYFVASDGSSSIYGPNYLLYRTDGTAAGTFSLGAYAPRYAGAPPVLAQLGGKLYFVGYDASHQFALFSTDGSAQAQLVAELGSSAPYSVTTVGSHLLLNFGSRLWTSDGTGAGTHALDLSAFGSIASLGPPIIANGKAYFGAYNGSTVTLLSTDGTTVSSVSDPSFAGYTVGAAASFDGRLVLTLYNPRTGGGALATWDGVSSPVILQSSVSGAPGSVIIQDGKIYFAGTNDAAAGAQAAGLYVSDGTPAGTVEIAQGTYSKFVQVGSHYVLEDSAGVYVSDGSPASVTRVAAGFASDPFVRAGAKAFFTVSTLNGPQLWVTDGTAAGTHLVEQGLSAQNITAVGDHILFSGATDGVNFEPWTSDGTAGGTHQIADIKPISPGNIGAQDAIAFGSKTVFIDSAGRALVTDGTAAGTGVLVNSPYSYAVRPDMIVAGGKLFFEVTTANGPQLFVSAGVPGDAHAIGALTGSGPATMFTALNGKLYFYDATVTGAGLGAGGLYVTDGTDAGTHQVAAMQVLEQPLVAGGELIFYGSDGATAGIFASTGAAGAGAVKIADATWNGGGVVVGGKAYFRAWDQVNGDELWVSDGTAAGTHVIKDIAPGLDTSSASTPVAFGSGVIFTADDGVHGREVWYADGSAAGAYLVSDINPTVDATASLNLNPYNQISPPSLISFGSGYAFLASDGAHGPQVWLSDGTGSATRLTNLVNNNGAGPHGLATLNGKLFYFDGFGHPWISDGTAAGSHMIGDGSVTYGAGQIVLDGKVYFEGTLAAGGGSSYCLLATDGTTVAKIATLSVNDANLLPAITVGDNLFYFAFGKLEAYNALSATTTDITTSGQVQVSAELVQGGELYYIAASNTGLGLYKSDGTSAGTSLVQTVSGQTSGVLSYFAAVSGGFYFAPFAVNYGGGQPALWYSDGTTAGTVQISLPSNANVSYLQQLTPDGNKLYFVERFVGAAPELLVYDPSTHATNVVHALSADLLTPVVAGGVLYFEADDASGNGQLWRDGASGPTMLTTSANGASPNDLTVLGAKVLFLGADSTHAHGLFVSDGTSAGTKFLASMDPNLTYLPSMTVIGGKLYFQGYDGANGDELWVTDGTVAGTHRVSDVEFPNGSNADGFTVVGSHVLFSANDGSHGTELWSFDGSPGTAKMLVDINPGVGSSNPTYLTAMGSALYFVANSGSGNLLWRSDGTAAGTAALTTASNGGAPQILQAVGSELFFFSSDTAHGQGLFVTDGTLPGTKFLHSFSSMADLVVSGGKLTFEGTDPVNGTEMWSSDGTVAGTVKITATGVNSGSNPSGFTEFGDYHAGTGGSDTFHVAAGDGVYDGGAGNDFAVYAGNAHAYTIGMSGAAGTVSGGPEGGTDTLTSVENLVFADGVLTFDQNNAAAVVMRMYDTTFGRAPDVLGGQYWTHLYESGQVSLTDMAADFAGSAEFQHDVAGMSQRQVVDFMYQNTLHRPADQAGEDAWTAYLQQGHSLGDLVLQFSESAEHKALTAPQVAAGLWDGDASAQTVEFMYEAAFGRAPDAGGLTTWVGALRGGLSLHDMAQAFVSSTEFANATQGMSHRQLVDYMYETALHRAADPTGETSWTIYLDNGGSAADLLVQFEQSQELQLANASHIDHGVWVV